MRTDKLLSILRKGGSGVTRQSTLAWKIYGACTPQTRRAVRSLISRVNHEKPALHIESILVYRLITRPEKYNV